MLLEVSLIAGTHKKLVAERTYIEKVYSLWQRNAIVDDGGITQFVNELSEGLYGC